ncbi:MAG TPA: SRPBCC domain-containing protein [Fimbriimonas sp.]|nr:SRPBCC domain-containing protein [Fimbriimonas sp.]
MNDDLIFRALADESRRRLLDSLFQEDGQNLLQLEGELPGMTRFGVMKHLGVLEEAGLIVTVKQGRQKLHYLNPSPIGDVYDRWVGKYAQPHLRILAGIKSSLEKDKMTTTKTNTHVIQTYIRATPEAVWQAITNPDQTEKYYFDTRLDSTLAIGSPFRYIDPKGDVMLDGAVLECEPPLRLVCTMIPKWDGEAVDAGTVTYELFPMGDMTKVRLTHVGLPEGHPLIAETFSGWSYILAGLKTYLETGSRLEPAGA